MQQNNQVLSVELAQGALYFTLQAVKTLQGLNKEMTTLQPTVQKKNIINRMKSGNWKALRNTKVSVQDTVSHRQSGKEYCNILNRNQGLNQSSRGQ